MARCAAKLVCMQRAPVPSWMPNAISVVRVLLVPLWALCAETANRTFEGGGDGAGLRNAAALTLVAIGASDALDGWLARRFDLQSRLGANLDAIADKLAQIVLTTYLALRVGPAFAAIAPWFLGLLIGRDALLALGCLLIWRRRGRVDTEHGWHGKVSSLCLFAVLVAASFGAGQAAITTMVWITAAAVVASTAAYTHDGVRQFRAR
jgi:phosphatidylglycerophosphate synthase